MKTWLPLLLAVMAGAALAGTLGAPLAVGLLAAAVAKLTLVDLGHTSALQRIASFLGVGC